MQTDNIKHKTREQWLNAVAHEMRPIFEKQDAPIPENVRISIGFTSYGAKGKAIGQCWTDEASKDGHFEIFINPNLPYLDQYELSLQTGAILAHELVHAAVGHEAGHGKDFKRVALGIGLEGKMRTTVPGEQFKTSFEKIHRKVGDIPHATLSTMKPMLKKKQSARLIKCICNGENDDGTSCGYTARTTRMWLDSLGAPWCPVHGPMSYTLGDSERVEE